MSSVIETKNSDSEPAAAGDKTTTTDALAIEMPSDRVREMLFRRIPTDSDFDAFCLDFFSDTARLFASGMDRQMKINLLFQRAGTRAVLSKLRERFPSPDQEGALGQAGTTSTPRPGLLHLWLRPVTMILASFLGGAIALLTLHKTLLHVATFSPYQRGVVFYQPLFASPSTWRLAASLCKTLQIEAQVPTRCASVLPFTSQTAAVSTAARALAGVVAILGADEAITVTALTAQSHPVLRLTDLPHLSITTPAEVRSAARAIDLLRRYVSDGENVCNFSLNLDDVEPHYALIGILLRSRCNGGRPLEGDGDSSKYFAWVKGVSDALCIDKTPSDVPCALAQYFLALDCPADKPPAACKIDPDAILKTLSEAFPNDKLGQLASIERSRRTCDSSPREAIEILKVVLAHTGKDDPCQRAAILPMLFCARTNLPVEDPQRAVVTALIPQLKDALSQCPETAGQGLAELGTRQLQRRRFEQAAKTLGWAQKFTASSRTAVTIAEAHLWLAQPEAVARSLLLAHEAEELSAHAAFLLWLARPCAQTAQRLKDEYKRVRNGKQAVFDATHTLNEFSCGKSGAASVKCKVLEVLLSKKEDPSSQDTLERILK